MARSAYNGGHPMRITIVVLLGLVASVSFANADACDDFITRVGKAPQPELCIIELQKRLYFVEQENKSLQAQLCTLVLELQDVKPSAYEQIKHSCEALGKELREKYKEFLRKQ